MREDYREVRDNFLGYYNRELSYLRQLGTEFGRKHPTIASRLRLEPDQCDDPHVERLLEAFAFLAARIHLRIDDEFPEITSALIEELYPHFTRPVPSISMVEFQLDPERGRLTTGRKIPRGTSIESRPSEGFVCKFRTCYDTVLWPLTVESATWRPGSSLPAGLTTHPTTAAIEVRLSCLPDVTFSGLDLSRLRFYLNGGFDVVGPLYELLLHKCHTILVQDPVSGAPKSFRLEAGALTPVGFAEDEGLCWYPARSFAGYQTLEDYFVFPEKYLFVDLSGLEGLKKNGFGRQASIVFLISPFERGEWRSILEQGVSSKMFRLGCTPIVNLFPVASDPMPVSGYMYEMPIPTDPRMEIYSVEGVYGQVSFAAGRRRFDPFISCRNGDTTKENFTGYWKAIRRPGRHDENTSEVFLSLCDRRGLPLDPKVDSVTVKLTCTNRDRPFRLPMSDPRGDFQMEEYPEVQRILCLHRPTAGCSAPSARTSLWRLVSQLALNHLSLVDEGKEALQCLLRVHSFGDSESAAENIAGIVALASRAHFARVSSEHGMAFVRGKRVEITLDESCFVGSSVFLFGNVLERFLGLYTSLNSFSQLVLRSRQRGDKPMHVWPARAGAKVVL